jgi:hypothetical protein
VSALPHPENDNLPPAFHGCLDQIHGLLESGIKTPSHCPNLGQFDLHHFARPRKVIHAAFLERDDDYSILILQLTCFEPVPAVGSSFGHSLAITPI